MESKTKNSHSSRSDAVYALDGAALPAHSTNMLGIITRLRLSARYATTLLRALLVLTHTEVARPWEQTTARDQYQYEIADSHQPQ